MDDHQQIIANRKNGVRNRFLRLAILIISMLLGISVQFLVVWKFHDSLGKGRSDFEGFYGAGRIVASGIGKELYVPAVQVETEHRAIDNKNGPAHYFIHAPFEALLFAPLTKFSYVEAVWCWWVLTLAFGYGAVWAVLPLLPAVYQSAEKVLLAFAVFVPLLFLEVQGQDTALTLFLFALCFRCLKQNRAWVAGIALAVTTSKLTLAMPMLVILAFSSGERKRLLGGFIATCLLLTALSAAAVGWSGFLSYPHALLHFGGYGGQANAADMPNITGLVNWTLSKLSPAKLNLITLALSTVVVAVAAWLGLRASRNTETDSLRFAVAMVASILAGFHEYVYDLALLVLPLLLVSDWSASLDAQPKRRRVLSGLAGFLFFASFLSWLGPPIYTSALVLLFVVICRELYLSGPSGPIPRKSTRIGSNRTPMVGGGLGSF